MARRKIPSKRININLYPVEQEIVKKMEEVGYNLSEIIRELIRNWGNATFKKVSGYVELGMKKLSLEEERLQKEQELKNMTPEEYATKILRGRVKENKVWFRVLNGNEYFLDLGSIKAQTKESNDLIKYHNMLLDGTALDWNNQIITKEMQDFALQGWAEGETLQEYKTKH
jgi:hypothetical protein